MQAENLNNTGLLLKLHRLSRKSVDPFNPRIWGRW